jgi:Holliday junction resolvasome RuvABC endonuclease subunit
LPKDADELARARRLQAIRSEVLGFVKRHGCRVAVLEQYAFSSQASQAHALGELGGVIKVLLAELQVEVHVVPPASARKLLGKAPRKDVKVWAHQRLYTAGAPHHWTGDQLDAFVVANYYLSGGRGDALMIPAEAA